MTNCLLYIGQPLSGGLTVYLEKEKFPAMKTYNIPVGPGLPNMNLQRNGRVSDGFDSKPGLNPSISDQLFDIC